MWVVNRMASWLLVLPMTASSLTVGHWLAYRLVVPDGHQREAALAQTGHAYLAYAPLVLALCFSLGAISLLRRAVAGYRGHGQAPSLAASLALLPPLAFLVQEQLERLVHSSQPALTPPILVGVLLQIPIAIVAVYIARSLESLATRLGAAVATAPPPRLRISPLLPAPAPAAAPRRVAGLALGYAERGPPARRA
jgi:hypothetical protein